MKDKGQDNEEEFSHYANVQLVECNDKDFNTKITKNQQKNTVGYLQGIIRVLVTKFSDLSVYFF